MRIKSGFYPHACLIFGHFDNALFWEMLRMLPASVMYAKIQLVMCTVSNTRADPLNKTDVLLYSSTSFTIHIDEIRLSRLE